MELQARQTTHLATTLSLIQYAQHIHEESTDVEPD